MADLAFLDTMSERYLPGGAQKHADMSVDKVANADSFYMPASYQVRSRHVSCFSNRMFYASF
jgi:hypothetical protein